MAKLNKAAPPAPVTSPVRSTSRAVTAQGGVGYIRDAESELYLLAITNMVGEKTFYEAAGDRDARFRALVGQLAVSNPSWLRGFIPYLRTEMGMRTASVVAAAEYALAGGPTPRQVVAGALQRADEPGELLAYWKARTGGLRLPKGVKRGVADAVARLYNQRSALKYGGTGSRDFTLADVLELVHPAPGTPEQSELYRYLLDRRHGRVIEGWPYETLATVWARRTLEDIPREQRAAWLATPGAASALRMAGATWEYVGGWLGGAWTAQAWEAVIPSMGVMALIRNLRNFDRAGVSDEVAQQVIAKITNPEDVRASRAFPFRFLAAHRAAPSLRWGHGLEKALDLSLSNVPALPGNTLVLVDRSGSMQAAMSDRSDLNRADAAAVFGTALAMRAEKATLVQFGDSARVVKIGKGDSLLRVVTERYTYLGGTYTATAVRQHLTDQHTRVVIVTDEQSAWDGDPAQVVPANVPLYTWNLAGYRVGGVSGVANRHTFGGLSDAAFQMIPLLEARRSGATGWPWEI